MAKTKSAKQKVRLWHTEVDRQRHARREEYLKEMVQDIGHQAKLEKLHK